MAELNLDLSGYGEWNAGFVALPAGEYHVCVTNVDVLVGKYSNRQYIKAAYTVTEGQFARRQVFDTFALWADNSKVARMRFKSFRAACGLNPNVAGSTEELFNKEFVCVLKTKERNDRPGEQENIVSGYKRLAGTRPAPQGIPAPNYTPAPMAGNRIAAPQIVTAYSPTVIPAAPAVQGSETASASDTGLPW